MLEDIEHVIRFYLLETLFIVFPLFNLKHINSSSSQERIARATLYSYSQGPDPCSPTDGPGYQIVVQYPARLCKLWIDQRQDNS